MNVIGIDLGGTRIKGVLLDSITGMVRHQLLRPTDDGEVDGWKRVIAGMVDELKKLTDEPVGGIGLSAPGLPSVAGDCIACMPGRLAGLENFSWSSFLGEPVRVLNDAHAALMAESRFGVARGYQHALMLTLGTGVGGGLLLNGDLYRGFYQMAGHFGHTSLDADSEQAGITGTPGSLEDAIGNSTVSRRSHGRYQSTYDLLAAYQQQEPLATWVWLTSVRRLAAALASMANAFSPELIVLGGGIVQAQNDLFGPLQTFMNLFEWRPAGKQTIIKKAFFDEWAGAIGAAANAVDDGKTKEKG